MKKKNFEPKNSVFFSRFRRTTVWKAGERIRTNRTSQTMNETTATSTISWLYCRRPDSTDGCRTSRPFEYYSGPLFEVGGPVLCDMRSVPLQLRRLVSFSANFVKKQAHEKCWPSVICTKTAVVFCYLLQTYLRNASLPYLSVRRTFPVATKTTHGNLILISRPDSVMGSFPGVFDAPTAMRTSHSIATATNGSENPFV